MMQVQEQKWSMWSKCSRAKKSAGALHTLQVVIPFSPDGSISGLHIARRRAAAYSGARKISAPGTKNSQCFLWEVSRLDATPCMCLNLHEFTAAILQSPVRSS